MCTAYFVGSPWAAACASPGRTRHLRTHGCSSSRNFDPATPTCLCGALTRRVRGRHAGSSLTHGEGTWRRGGDGGGGSADAAATRRGGGGSSQRSRSRARWQQADAQGHFSDSLHKPVRRLLRHGHWHWPRARARERARARAQQARCWVYARACGGVRARARAHQGARGLPEPARAAQGPSARVLLWDCILYSQEHGPKNKKESLPKPGIEDANFRYGRTTHTSESERASERRNIITKHELEHSLTHNQPTRPPTYSSSRSFHSGGLTNRNWHGANRNWHAAIFLQLSLLNGPKPRSICHSHNFTPGHYQIDHLVTNTIAPLWTIGSTQFGRYCCCCCCLDDRICHSSAGPTCVQWWEHSHTRERVSRIPESTPPTSRARRRARTTLWAMAPQRPPGASRTLWLP